MSEDRTQFQAWCNFLIFTIAKAYVYFDAAPEMGLGVQFASIPEFLYETMRNMSIDELEKKIVAVRERETEEFWSTFYYD